jgi:two-component sensor histidine kinase
MHIADRAVYVRTGMPLGARQTQREPVSVGRLVPRTNSRFELIAAQHEALPSHFGDLFGLLLQAAYAAEGVGRPVLMPLWAEEGMHRAYAMLRLIDRRAQYDRGRVKNGFTTEVECALARSLACAYRSLATAKEDEVVQCSALLREVVLNLGALFGGGGGVIVRTAMERLSMPAYKRRALVLAASELMINALTHAFGSASRDGRIEITLRLLDDGRARLRVADNGAGFGARRPNTATGIAGGLADLVEADLTYGRTADWTTVAEIVFPVESAAAARTIDEARHPACAGAR